MNMEMVFKSLSWYSLFIQVHGFVCLSIHSSFWYSLFSGHRLCFFINYWYGFIHFMDHPIIFKCHDAQAGRLRNVLDHFVCVCVCVCVCKLDQDWEERNFLRSRPSGPCWRLGEYTVTVTVTVSDLCVCVPCELVVCVFVTVLVCLRSFVLDLSAVFTRAASPPSAKFRLLKIVVLLRLYPQPSFGAVLTVGSDSSLVSVCSSVLSHVSVLSCVFVCHPISCTHPLSCKLFDCTHSYALSLNHTLCFSVYLLSHTCHGHGHGHGLFILATYHMHFCLPMNCNLVYKYTAFPW